MSSAPYGAWELRSKCALFIGFRLFSMVLGVIR
jgi:hypothetical protein